MFSKKVSLLYKITMLVLTIIMLILTILPSGVAVAINTSSESINTNIIYDYLPTLIILRISWIHQLKLILS